MGEHLPLVLCILDGWGEAPAGEYNAVAAARTPNLDALRAHYPHGLIEASEHYVGLPAEQMGNSEVGHMNIGAGRILLQDLPRIDAAIESGALAKHPQLLAHIAALQSSGGTCHLIGLASDGGVHAHIDHILYLVRVVAGAGVKVAIHAVLDGRDTPPKSAEGFLRLLEEAATHPNIRIATISGRYFAMDRDQRWERVSQAYAVLTSGKGEAAASALTALQSAYARGETDEFVTPIRIHDYAGMKDGDGVLMCNFRADRARQFLHALCDEAFTQFERPHRVQFAHMLGMIRYSEALNFIPALFEPQNVSDTLGEVTSRAGLRQLRIAETEKYAHVTFFFNGGREEVFEGESRIMVPSPNVATYDLKPEMAAAEVTAHVVHAIETKTQDIIIINFANTDMVGHCGKLDAAVKAVEAVDAAVGQIVDALIKTNGALIVTADHGNAEAMHDHRTNQAHTQHTTNPVPLIIMHPQLKGRALQLPHGALSDIAPTILAMLGIQIPHAMTGNNLLAGVLG